jgi:ribosomal protein L34E
VKQEKESLIVQLSESHALIDSLRSKNTMLFNLIDELENKLAKFSSDNLKSMLCIHSDVSNKPDLVVDDLSASTSHASDSELDSSINKPVIVDTACLDNSCLNNCVKPKSKESGTRGKFVPICHNCGKTSHIRPNCYLLESHRSWIKQDAMRKSEVDDSSSSKYVPPHRRHIKGKGNVICKNANHNFAENVKKHSNKRSLPTCHHCGITGHIRSKCPQFQKLKVQRKLPTRATSGTLHPTALQASRHQQQFVLAYQSGKSKKNKPMRYKRKLQKPNGSHGYEGLLSLIQGMLWSMANMDMTRKPSPRVKQVWVKDETIHPMSGNERT